MSYFHDPPSSTTRLPALLTETGSVDEYESYWVFRSGLACVRLTIQHNEIAATQFGKEYVRYVGGRDGEMVDLSACGELAKAACRTLAFESESIDIQDCTLAELCHCPLYSLRLVEGEGWRGVTPRALQAVKYGTIAMIEALPVTDLPDACGGLPYTSVDRVSLTRRNGSDLSGRATLTGDDDGTYWFKPREDVRTEDFDREITLLSQVRKGQLAGRFKRVVRLNSLVTVDLEEGGTQCIGMLLYLIPTGEHGGEIGEQRVWKQRRHHTRWQSQVESTVRKLHAEDIVWGDVNVGNVIIDEDLEAWVLDFGGMNNVEFVDDDNRETRAGDWQGVRTMFDVWLPSRFDGRAKFVYSGDDTQEYYRPDPVYGYVEY